MKICGTCGIEKPFDEFYHHKAGPKNCPKKIPNKNCKECEKKANKEHREKVKAEPIAEGTKDCKNCGPKPCAEFRPLRGTCLECERKDCLEYRQSDIGKAKTKEWNDNNVERMAELQRNSYQKNKEKINEKNRDKYNNDPIYRFKHNCRRRIQQAFGTYKDLKKDGDTIEYLGSSIEHLAKWFEYCYDDKMTHENHGEYWHMDHVLPVNLWDLTDQIHIDFCFHWANLSPLNSSENMSKHDSIDTMQLMNHMNKLLDFLSEMNKKDYLKYSEGITNYVNLCARHLISGKPLRASVTHL